MGNRILIRAMLSEDTGQLVPLSVKVVFRGKTVSNWKLGVAESSLQKDAPADDSPTAKDADEERKAADDLSAIQDTDIKKGAIAFDKCPHLPRLLLALLTFATKKDAVFSKTLSWGIQLADLLRKGVNPDWSTVLFKNFDLAHLFRWPQPDGKGSRKYPERKGVIEIDEDNFPATSISLRICNENRAFQNSEAAINALTRVVSGNSRKKLTEYVPDVQFAKRLGAKLEIPGITDDRVVLAGKIVWLSQLRLLSKVLETQLVGDSGFLTILEVTLQENILANAENEDPSSPTSILQEGDLEKWRARLDQICQGPFSHELFEAAEYAKLPVQKLKESIRGMLKMTKTWPKSADDWKDWLAKTELAKTTVNEFISTLMQTTGNCRGYLAGILNER